MRLSWRSVFGVGCAIFVSCQALPAQQRADGRSEYERLLAVVPMVGSGTYDDPRRPAYVPQYLLSKVTGRPLSEADPFVMARAKREAPKAITGFHYELSDGEQFALVEFWATHPSAFEPLRSAARQPGGSLEPGSNRNALEGGFDLKVFEVGKAKRADIETEFRKHKRNFSLETFGGHRR